SESGQRRNGWRSWPRRTPRPDARRSRGKAATSLQVASRRLHPQVTLDRDARVDQHALAPELLVEAGAAHGLENVGVESYQPDVGAALRPSLLARHHRLQRRV